MKSKYVTFGILVLAIIGIVLISEYIKQEVGVPEREDCIMRCLPTFEEEVVWAEFIDVPHSLLKNIYLLDISTGTKSIVNSQPAHISGLSKYEDKVVWVDDRKSNFTYKNHTMYMKDLSTGKETELISTPASISRFYKDKIAFIALDIREGTSMYVYDLDTDTKTEIAATLVPGGASSVHVGPPCLDIYEDKIAFKDYAGTPTIYLLDLDTMIKTKIAEDSGQYSSLTVGANCPSIYKNKVVYGIGNKEFTTTKIYLYDIITGSSTELTELEKPFILGSIYDIEASNLKIDKDKVRYLMSVSAWVGPDMSATYINCILVDINSKEKTDITCKGGVLERAFSFGYVAS